MARTNTQSFDINAYLNTAAAVESKSLLTTIADSTENIVQRIGFRAGKAAESLNGTGDIFALGRKVGAVASAKRVEYFKARAYAEIEAMLK